MKKIFTLFLLAACCQLATAQLVNKSLIVPEFCPGIIRTFNPSSATTIEELSGYTILISLLSSSFNCGGGVGNNSNAKVNCVAMFGNDLYASLTGAFCQRIYKFTNYKTLGNTASVSQVTGAGGEYVGIGFDVAGNLYASEGPSYGNTSIVRYTAAAGTGINLGNGGVTSYFSNFAFDATGNLWASDYSNNRIIAIAAADLTTTNATMHVYTTNTAGAMAVSNTTAGLTGATNRIFSRPEGLAFDSNGNLWVANNNDDGANSFATLVKISPALQATILGAASTTATSEQANIYNVPNPLPFAQVASCFNAPISARSQLGGLQIDVALNRIYVNEQTYNKGLWFDISTIAAVSTYAAQQMLIISTNPGNGGIYLTQFASPLPIVLTDFSGKATDRGNLLSWATDTENKNLGFEIERSADGKNFEKLGFKAGAGTTASHQEYQFTDDKPSAGNNYYRLRQIDESGEKTTYSKIIVINNSKPNSFQIYPNPAQGELFVVGLKETTPYRIFNTVGAIVMQGIYEADQAINLSDLESGLYSLQMGGQSFQFVKK